MFSILRFIETLNDQPGQNFCIHLSQTGSKLYLTTNIVKGEGGGLKIYNIKGVTKITLYFTFEEGDFSKLF